MDTEVWNKASDNTNVAEASHANINHEGKALSLENAILKAKYYDKYHFAICNIQDKYRISKSGKNHSILMHEKQAIKRLVHNSQKTKRRINKPTKVSKKVKVDIDSTQDMKSNLEMQEKQLAIKKQKLELEERKVHLEHEKLEIIKLKKELECE
ncbi:16069_t:CDS:2 [Gigaspora margarita]|uniref:16069_t:CDS:1 n=1 Tax=Gigaspora margarita TaxID=4874 RepID=A0ABN7WSS4_GIGMA|nr:16069_t:CDS:2 [Gigaspora margarita]